MATSPAPSTTFTLFPLLPFELRLKIWSFALSIPRTVTIACKKDMLNRERRYVTAFTTTSPPPAPLHACREARSEALKIYKPYFRAPVAGRFDRHEIEIKIYKSSTRPSDVYTYFNFEIDTVKCANNILEYFGGEEIQGIQRMVLEVMQCDYFEDFSMGIIKSMPKLVELDLLTKPDVDLAWRRSGVMTLIDNFDDATHSDPGWKCSRVRIFVPTSNGELEEAFGIDGGALLPSWKKGDEIPEEIERTRNR